MDLLSVVINLTSQRVVMHMGNLLMDQAAYRILVVLV